MCSMYAMHGMYGMCGMYVMCGKFGMCRLTHELHEARSSDLAAHVTELSHVRLQRPLVVSAVLGEVTRNRLACTHGRLVAKTHTDHPGLHCSTISTRQQQKLLLTIMFLWRVRKCRVDVCGRAEGRPGITVDSRRASHLLDSREDGRGKVRGHGRACEGSRRC